jgi:SAM-dependent methyltransferase
MVPENIAELAAYEFETARTQCANCNDYHALWGYLRLTRIVSKGFETERDILEPLLHEHAPPRARILIAGAADAGLLAFVAGALEPQPADITVADRCPTPLAVCRRYAEANRFPITTIATDLTTTPLTERYDLAFLHNMLMLQPPDLHTPLLANLRRALEPRGTLILVNRVRTKMQASPPPPAHFASQVVNALAGLGVALPENEGDFRRRLERYVDAQRRWSDVVIDRDHVEASLRAAGFAILRRIDHDRRQTAPARDGGNPVPMQTNIFVARPQKAE